MRFGNILAIVLLVLIIFGAIYFIDQKDKYKSDREVWLADKAELQKVIDVADERALAEEAKANEALAQANRLSDEKTELQRQLQIERAEHERDLLQIETLAPDQVVIAHHYHLKVDKTGVWLTNLGVQFSLDAARKNLAVLEKYEFLIKKEIPNYKSQMQKQEEENEALRRANLGFSNSNKQLHVEIGGLKAQVAGETTLRVKAESMIGFQLFSVESIALFLGGVVLGGVIVAVF